MNKHKYNSYRMGKDTSTQTQLKIMLMPAVILIFVFNIIPLFGLVISFKNYRPASGIMGLFTSPWSGLRNFRIIFRNYDFWPMLRNTLGINLLGNFIGIPITLFFALFLNEIKNVRFKSFIQTITYMPHFISWVVYGGLFITLLSIDGGFVNSILLGLGLISAPVPFLADPKYFWAIAVITGLMKELGWGAILYLAAIAGVDQELYEGAMIDGAGRFRKMWYITIPCIKPTLMIMIIFAVSGMLNNNFTQIYVFQNTLNISRSQVLDTYIYQIGLQQLQFGTATAVGLTKSILAVVLLSGANWISKRLTDAGLF
jgi:putative aldouronate transport system permease protein